MSKDPPVARRATWQKVAVRDEVLSRHDHPTAADVHVSLRSTGIGLATVYRHLASLVEEGTVRAVEHNGETRYDCNTGPHAHAACTRCGELWDVPLPESLVTHGVERMSVLDEVHLTYAGLCSACE